MSKYFCVLLSTITITILISSCSVFKSSRQIDLEPFSENANILFGETSKMSRPFMWKYLHVYTKRPEYQRLIKNTEPILRILNGIVYYSHQIVAISNSRLKEKDKNRQLRNYLFDVFDRVDEKESLDSLGLNKETLQQVLDDIPKADSYLEAVDKASPIINSVVLTVQDRLDDLQNDISDVLEVFDQKIEEDYTNTRANYLGMKALQEENIALTKLLYLSLMGKHHNLDTLLQRDNSLKKFFPSPPLFTTGQIEEAGEYLHTRLQKIDVIIQQMMIDVARYHAKKDEIKLWRLTVDEKIRVARNAISVWAQSHRNLGNGIPVPPLIDVAGFTGGVVGSAVNRVVP